MAASCVATISISFSHEPSEQKHALSLVKLHQFASVTSPTMSNSNASTAIPIDVAVIGGGQSALAVAWFLRRAGIGYVVLDDQPAPGGAWQHTWDSLHLFLKQKVDKRLHVVVVGAVHDVATLRPACDESGVTQLFQMERKARRGIARLVRDLFTWQRCES